MLEPPIETPQDAPMWRRVAWIILLAALATMTARIFAVRSASGNTPFLSANDRSRWSTIRALVDHGTYALDPVIVRRDGRFDRDWQTIDLVRHHDRHGRLRYYSSKPPLLTTMIAGVYWALKASTGSSLSSEPFYYGRAILLIVNVLPMLAYFCALLALVDRLGRTDWGRLFVMAVAAWGTFLTTFAVTLNNHLPAAISVLLAVWAALPLWQRPTRRWWRFAVAGVFAAFAAANDLPALSFAALLGAALLVKSPKLTLLGFAPAALAVAGAFFLVNWIAHESWRPPYAHRKDGPVVAKLAPAALHADQMTQPGAAPETLRQALTQLDIPGAEGAVVDPTPREDRWVVKISDPLRRFALIQAADAWQVREWDNWYDFPGSYWTRAERQGVDRGEPSRAAYAFHVLIGHHGVFSLTPVWLLSVIGAWIALTGRRRSLRALAAMTVVLTTVCLAFYLSRGQIDRNYGGVTSGFRWAFWLIPLWLLTLIPAADVLARRPWGRRLGLTLLFASALSAAYAWHNPWTHPWLYEYWRYLGWIQ